MSDCGHISKKQKMSAESRTDEVIFRKSTQEFLKIVKMVAHVDHSLLIKFFFKTETRLFVSAPTMFGKSSNMSMIKRFFAIKEDGIVEENIKDRYRYGVFENLKIMKENEQELTDHFCAHPVIHVDFKTPGPLESLQDAEEYCYRRICKAFEEHKHYLKKNLVDEDYKARCEKWWNSTCSADVDNVAEGLRFLCRCLYTAHKGKRVVILVDECDAAVISTIILHRDLTTMNAISSFMATILSGITKEDINDMVQSVLLTGISHIAGTGYSTDIKTINCRFLDDTSNQGYPRNEIVRFYGLHEVDLDELLFKLQYRLSLTDEEIQKRRSEIPHALTVYHTVKNGECIYPIYKVVGFIITGEINYEEAANIPHVAYIYREASTHPDFVPTILELLGNGSVNIDYSPTTVELHSVINLRDNPSLENLNLYFLLLLEVGILTRASYDSASAGKLAVKIPNQLTTYYFLHTLTYTFRSCYGHFSYDDMQMCKQHINTLKKLFLGECEEKFSLVLRDFHQVLKSLFRGFEAVPKERGINTKNALKGLIYMSLCSHVTQVLRVTTDLPIIDKQGNRGVIDIWVIDKKLNFAMVVTIKVNRNSDDTKEGNLKKTSIYALKEIRGEGEETVRYLDELEKRQIKDYFLLGLSMDSLCRPSISIATSRDQIEDKKKFFCVSETEPDDFPELCQFGIDLLKENKP